MPISFLFSNPTSAGYGANNPANNDEMATITEKKIQVFNTKVQIIDSVEESDGTVRPSGSENQISIIQYDISFSHLIGSSPKHSLLLTTTGNTNNPFFHEACVFIPDHDELYVTSNLLQATNSANFPTILISRVKIDRTPDSNDVSAVHWEKLRPPPGIDMPNGGVNFDDGIIFCAQGSPHAGTGGIYLMPRNAPPHPIVTNFHGRDFNSVNDIVMARDGSLWFTDPCYGYDQEFRRKPKLPNQVYRYDPLNGNIRVVADNFGRPNGICFSPDESVLYITDSDTLHGDGNRELTRAATIYAFDIILSRGSPFLANRRVFAYAVVGCPDGIKCDLYGNVYAGCGDGVEIWNDGGFLIGRILVPGGVTNFCFGREGEMFICAEQNLWRIQLAPETRGALLGI